jgi:hypothetical protein
MVGHATTPLSETDANFECSVATLPHQLSAVLEANLIEAVVAYAILMSGYGFHIHGPRPIRLTMGVTALFCFVMVTIAGVFLDRRVADSVQGGLVTCTWVSSQAILRMPTKRSADILWSI